jgi:Beta-lactamase superfamily domain
MLSVTFLGHQGWLCQSKQASILVDPLLCEEFGHTQALEYRVFPPRVFDWGQFPKLDAVVLSHEHDDHFDLPSLARLQRTIPIFLSARSSSAARRILSEMGFQVHPLEPGKSVRFEDLELTPFAGDHVNLNCGDEWDTLPFMVKHTGGSGNFFSLVDITLAEQHVDWARAKDARPVLVSWTNNALDWSHMADYLSDRVEATQECFMKMGVGHKLISTRWGTPAAMAMCAGGFSFTGEKSWMNQRVFCVDTEAVCEMMAKVYRTEKFISTRPGQTFQMEGHRLRKVLDRAPFLGTEPEEKWPSRARGDGPEAPDYSPATGRRTLDNGELDEIRRGLGELAGALVGGTVFKSLCSLLDSEAEERAPTFALVLRDGEARHVFAYSLTECAFVDGKADAREVYVAGLECWASDFLAVLRGELGPIALTFGRARLWNALSARLRFDIFGELYRMSHPLRRPDAYLRTYQRLWRESGNLEPTIFRRS